MSVAHDILKRMELKTTPVRERVLAEFVECGHALTQNELEIKLFNVDRVTLYRTLKTYEQKGIIHRIVDPSGIIKFALCDHCDEHHHEDNHVHFNCSICGNTFCIENIDIPTINLPTEYTAISTNITIQGICDNCS